MVAEVAVTPLEATALIMGTDAGVENVKLPDVVVPAESPEATSKS
jgi:hypothetical protein